MNSYSEIPRWLLVWGFTGQLAFSLRFLVQWVSSEIKRESHIPIAFWYFSVVGGVFLLVYAIFRKDPVIVVGQSAGLVVYLRNLRLIYKKEKESRRVDAGD